MYDEEPEPELLINPQQSGFEQNYTGRKFLKYFVVMQLAKKLEEEDPNSDKTFNNNQIIFFTGSYLTFFIQNYTDLPLLMNHF